MIVLFVKTVVKKIDIWRDYRQDIDKQLGTLEGSGDAELATTILAWRSSSCVTTALVSSSRAKRVHTSYYHYLRRSARAPQDHTLHPFFFLEQACRDRDALPSSCHRQYLRYLGRSRRFLEYLMPQAFRSWHRTAGACAQDRRPTSSRFECLRRPITILVQDVSATRDIGRRYHDRLVR